MNRETIISRIRKLSKLTTDNGATEHEALAAAEKLAQLIAEHNIGQDELSIKRDAQGCIADDFVGLKSEAGEIWSETCWEIGRLFNCRAVRDKHQTRETLDEIFGDTYKAPIIVVTYFGFPEDVAASMALAAIVQNAFARAQMHFVGTKASEKKRKSFQLGMAERIIERLKEMRVRPRAESGSRALISLKDQLVTEEWAKWKLRQGLRTRQQRGTSMKLDSGAYQAGRSAGDKVGLSSDGPTLARRQIASR